MRRHNHTEVGIAFLIICFIAAFAIYAALRERSATPSFAPPIQTAGADTDTLSPADFTFRSKLEGASLVRLAELPEVVPEPISDDGCATRVVEPKSPGGRAAVQRGWHIIQEEKLGELDAVLIVRNLEFMTSGRCRSLHANVALFHKQQLVGVLYPKGKRGIEISTMQAFELALRIWSPDPLVQGQIDLKGHQLTFGQVTGPDLVCGERYQVPAVFNLPYSRARAMLVAGGWQPIPSTADAEDTLDPTGERRDRFPEVIACSPTGYAGCDFAYRAPGGPERLTLSTLGDDIDPVVSSYAIECAE